MNVLRCGLASSRRAQYVDTTVGRMPEVRIRIVAYGVPECDERLPTGALIDRHGGAPVDLSPWIGPMRAWMRVYRYAGADAHTRPNVPSGYKSTFKVTAVLQVQVLV